jgi:hypothetical protein
MLVHVLRENSLGVFGEILLKGSNSDDDFVANGTSAQCPGGKRCRYCCEIVFDDLIVCLTEPVHEAELV